MSQSTLPAGPQKEGRSLFIAVALILFSILAFILVGVAVDGDEKSQGSVASSASPMGVATSVSEPSIVVESPTAAASPTEGNRVVAEQPKETPTSEASPTPTEAPSAENSQSANPAAEASGNVPPQSNASPTAPVTAAAPAPSPSAPVAAASSKAAAPQAQNPPAEASFPTFYVNLMGDQSTINRCAGPVLLGTWVIAEHDYCGGSRFYGLGNGSILQLKGSAVRNGKYQVYRVKDYPKGSAIGGAGDVAVVGDYAIQTCVGNLIRVWYIRPVN